MSYHFHSNRKHNLARIAAFHSRDFLVIAVLQFMKYKSVSSKTLSRQNAGNAEEGIDFITDAEQCFFLFSPVLQRILYHFQLTTYKSSSPCCAGDPVKGIWSWPVSHVSLILSGMCRRSFFTGQFPLSLVPSLSYQNKFHFNAEIQHTISGAPVKSHIEPTHSY